MVKNMSHYDVLNVSKNSSYDEIVKAYNILEKKYHSGENNSEDKIFFNNIREAFETLKDPQKRKMYDKSSGTNILFDPEKDKNYEVVDPIKKTKSFNITQQEIIKKFLSNIKAKINKESANDSNSNNSNNNIIDSKSSPPSQILFPNASTASTASSLPIFKYSLPSKNIKTQTLLQKKESTRSQVNKYELMDSPNGDEMIEFVGCTLEELFTGTIKTTTFSRERVNREKGNNYFSTYSIDIKIDAGFREGTRIRFPKMGNERAGYITSDLVIIVKEIEHETFKRYKKDDLIIYVDITLSKMTEGFMMSFRMIDGTEHSKYVEPFSKTDHLLILSQCGMPIRRNGHIRSYGDVYVGFNVDVTK
jgi:DnaJ-class molecular chaperone